MATARPNLDQGPPLPPNLQPKPEATLQGLAGQGQQADANGAGSLQKAIVEKLMFLEQGFNDVAELTPDAAPLMDDLRSRMRAGMAKILARGAQPPTTAATPGSLLMGAQPMSTPGM